MLENIFGLVIDVSLRFWKLADKYLKVLYNVESLLKKK